MGMWYRHRIWCVTEDKFVYEWTEGITAPTECPNDGGHSIGVTIVEEMAEDHCEALCICPGEVDISSASTDIGGITCNPTAVLPAADAYIRLKGEIETDGTVNLDLVENNGSSDESKMTSVYEVSDTSSAWTQFEFQTDVDVRSGTCSYKLKRASGGTATSATIRFVVSCHKRNFS